MSKIKVNNFSIKKIIGIVFLIITLIVGVALTNNTVRKFLFNSSADGGRVKNCRDKGSASGRNNCLQEEEYSRKAVNKDYYNNYLVPAYNRSVQSGQISRAEADRQLLQARIRLGL